MNKNLNKKFSEIINRSNRNLYYLPNVPVIENDTFTDIIELSPMMKTPIMPLRSSQNDFIIKTSESINGSSFTYQNLTRISKVSSILLNIGCINEFRKSKVLFNIIYFINSHLEHLN